MKISFIKKFLIDPAYKEKRDFLTHLPIFKGLKSADFTYLLRTLQERTYLKGETLFLEGDIGRALFIVVSGSIQLTRLDESGKLQPVAEVKPGEIFGEMALLEEMPRTATASAGEKSKVYLLYKNKLDALLYEYPRVGVVIVHYLAQMLSARLRSIIEAQRCPPAAPK